MTNWGRDLLPWGVSGACLVGSLMFPPAATPIWIAGCLLLAPFLVAELRKPVNYQSLDLDAQGFRFKSGAGCLSDVQWSEVVDVFYQRSFDPFANQIDTEWEFHTKSGGTVMVLVEWPQSKPFARAVVTNLPAVSADTVNKVLRIKEEGRWRCVTG